MTPLKGLYLQLYFCVFSRMKGARSRQEQLARQRIEAMKNKRKLSKEAKEQNEKEIESEPQIDTNNPIQLQVQRKMTFHFL